MRGLRSLADIYALLGISFFLLRFLHQQPIIISGSATDASTTAVLMSLINSAVQIFIIAFAAKRHSLFEQPLALVLLASIASIGQVLMYINNEGGVLAGTNLLIGGFMASLGAAMLPLLWHEIACRSQAAGHMRYVVALATIISALLFLIAFSFPEPISTILDSVSPLASLVFLLLARKENGDAFATKAVDDPLPEESNGTPSAIARYSPYMPLFIACFICTIPQGLVRSALFPPIDTAHYSMQTAIAFAILATTAALVASYLIESHVRIRILNIGIFQITLVAGMVAPFFLLQNPALASAAIVSSFLLFWSFFYSTLHDACTQPYQGVIVYSIGIVCQNLAGAVSAFFGGALASVPIQIVGIAVAIACLASLSFAKNFFFYESSDLIANEIVPQESDVLQQENYRNAVEQQCCLTAKRYDLSPREEEVLALLARGLTAKSISSKLFISYNTVRTHVSRIYTKLGVHTREELLQAIEDSKP